MDSSHTAPTGSMFLAAIAVRLRSRRIFAPITVTLVGILLSIPALAVTISGHVTDHLTGEALGGIPIRLWYQFTPYTQAELGTAITSADGAYTWNGDCPSTSTLWPCHATIDDPRYLYADIPFLRNQTNVPGDFVLVRAARMSGSIRIEGETPTQPVDLNIAYFSDADQSWHPMPLSRHDEDGGQYVVDGLAPGTPYRLCAGGPASQSIEQCFAQHDRPSFSVAPLYDVVTLTEGQHREGVDFDLSSGGHIEGVLHDGYLGQPLPQTKFEVLVYDGGGALVASFRTVSGTDGRYRVAGLPDGAYYLGALIDGPFVVTTQVYPGIVCESVECPTAIHGQRFQVSGGSTITSVDFTVRPQVVFKGRVTDASTGRGVGGVEIWASHEFRPSARTTDTGEYRFYTRGGPATYPFRVIAHNAQPYIDQVHPGASCTRSTCGYLGEPFNPAVGDVLEHVDFALQAGSAVSGRVYDAATGLPQGGSVSVYDSAFNLLWNTYSDDGSYLSDAWLPGTYYVKVETASFDCALFEAKPCPFSDQAPDGTSPTPVTIAAGQIRGGIDFHLRKDEVFRNGFGS